MVLAGCLQGEPLDLPRTPPNPPETPPREQFAQDRDPPPMPATLPAVPFDGQRAMTYLEELCRLGPRISGSPAMARQQELLTEHFTKLGAKVQRQEFVIRQRSRPQLPVEMVNLVISWHPDRKQRVILCGHYDTRPIADQERERRRWKEPFLSANDGTSTVAWLMELAHHMKDLPTQVGVDFVIFDGEEYIFDPTPAAQGGDRYFLGSEHFAKNYQRTRDQTGVRYLAAVLLDLFAGKNATYPIEQHSALAAGRLVETIWGIARELKEPAFRYEYGPAVSDDHLALNQAGIPAIDIIDFSYDHWHRLSDRPENCSAASMEQVARVLTVWLRRVKP
jgi:hypothetical protein